MEIIRRKILVENECLIIELWVFLLWSSGTIIIVFTGQEWALKRILADDTFPFVELEQATALLKQTEINIVHT